MRSQLICHNWSFKTYTFDFEPAYYQTFSEFLRDLSQKEGIHESQLRLVQNNKELRSLPQLNPTQILHVELKGGLKGAKGGFGSLLRSMNPKKKPTDNFEACRDLSGRRLRVINNEQRLEEWKRKQEEEEKFVQEETERYNTKKKELFAAIHANNFKVDDKYKKEVQSGAKSVVESLKEGQLKKREAKLNGKMQKKGLNLKELLQEEREEDPELNLFLAQFKNKKRQKVEEEGDSRGGSGKEESKKVEMIKPRG
jgi:hypothetical protein